MKSRLEAINTTFQQDIKRFKAEGKTEFEESINQIQKAIDAKISE